MQSKRAEAVLNDGVNQIEVHVARITIRLYVDAVVELFLMILLLFLQIGNNFALVRPKLDAKNCVENCGYEL